MTALNTTGLNTIALSITELSLPILLYTGTAACLFAIGVYGFIIGPQTLRRILALNIIGAGIFMLMVVLAYRGTVYGAVAASPDPVLHALILTGLVVAVSATAFALALLARLKQAKPAKDALGQEPLA